MQPLRFEIPHQMWECIWKCPWCLTQLALAVDDLLSALPFTSVSDESYLSIEEGQEGLNTDNAIHNGEDGESHLADLTQHLQSFPAKDLRVAHLNVCSLRNKMDELRCLQLLCKFDMTAITETHLGKTVPDSALDIKGMNLLRLDRKGRKGGGCALYFAEHLQATQRKDLHFDSLEGFWLHIKFPSSTALFAVMYRPPDADHFFDLVNSLLEKAWLKSSNIFLMGDFNCDFSTKGLLSANTSKLPSIFEMFNMENVIQEATRQKITSSSLIDLIVTTRKDLVSATGVFPLGISDRNLIYATIRLKNKRPPPIIVKTRDYKRMDIRSSRDDIESAPFHIASIFDDPDDNLWVWQYLFNDLCDKLAPWKNVKIRSISAPWMTSDIRLKMNRRYKLFKEAVSTKFPRMPDLHRKKHYQMGNQNTLTGDDN